MPKVRLCLLALAVTSCTTNPYNPEDSIPPEAVSQPADDGWIDSREIPSSTVRAEPVMEPAPYAPPVAPPPPVSASLMSRDHTVVKGDTLYQLARTYYGDAKRWRMIFDANRTTIKEPNRLLVGQRLVIPE